MKPTVKIWYADDETGPAEILGGNMARVVDAPLLTLDIWQNDIVRLAREPSSGNGYPRIVEVVHTRHPERTYLEFHSEAECHTLRAILALLDAECRVILPPDGDKPGEMSVAHQGDIDPVALAQAIGIAQSDEVAW